jgi:hypothetical protein
MPGIVPEADGHARKHPRSAPKLGATDTDACWGAELKFSPQDIVGAARK